VQAGYIEPLIAPYWNHANADFAKSFTMTFALESGMPGNSYLAIELPTKFFAKVTSARYRLYRAPLASQVWKTAGIRDPASGTIKYISFVGKQLLPNIGY
jgi:hypothetical protein